MDNMSLWGLWDDTEKFWVMDNQGIPIHSPYKAVILAAIRNCATSNRSISPEKRPIQEARLIHPTTGEPMTIEQMGAVFMWKGEEWEKQQRALGARTAYNGGAIVSAEK